MNQSQHGAVKTKGSVRTMQHKCFAWAMGMAMAAAIACTGCTSSDTSPSANSGTSTQITTASSDTSAEETDSKKNTASAESLSTLQGNVTGVSADEDDLCSTYDSFDAEIQLADDKTAISGSKDGITVNGNTICIGQGGTYRISGTLSSGQLLVTGTEKVRLYLDGAEITNENGPALLCLNEKRTILSLAKGTKNTLADGKSYQTATVDTQEIDPCAVYAQDKLTINGSGTLTVQGNCRDGIVCKDDLKLVGGTLDVQAAEDGIKGKDCVAMLGAEVSVSAGNDGIKSTESEDDTKGFLQLDSGTAHITAGGDCFQAETLVAVQGGTYTLTSDGSFTKADTGGSASAKGIHCSGNILLNGGTLTVDTPEDGIHCTGNLLVQGGSADITSGEDGVQADGDMTLTGGTLNITTTGEVAASAHDDFGGMPGGDFGGGNGGNPPEMPDGAPSDMPQGGFGGDMPNNGDTGSMPQFTQPAGTTTAENESTETESAATAADTASDASSKGLKCGGTLTCSGGSCTIQSTDHAVHCAGSAVLSGTDMTITSDNKGISVHGDLEISGGDICIQQCTEGIESKAEMVISGGSIRILAASDDGLNTGGTTGSHAMTITGGYLYICADGDGVDSNGTLEMSGGTLLICGPTSGGDGSLDFETDMTYSGGTLLALSSRGMMEYPESGCLVATNCSAEAGDLVAIADGDGNVVAVLRSPKAVSDVIYGIGSSSADDYQIITGGTYDGDLNEDGFGTGGTISGGTSVTANGGSGSMSGGFGGGMGGGMPAGDPPSGAPGGDFGKNAQRS